MGCSGDRLRKVHEQSDLSFGELPLTACEKQLPGFNNRSVATGCWMMSSVT